MLRLADAFSCRNPRAVGADRRTAAQLRTSRRTTGHGRCRGRRDREPPSPGRRGRHRRGQELRLPRAGHPGHGRKAPSDDDEEAPPRRVVISTHTISLQEQLLTKDIPLLRSVMPTEFTAVLVKGRRNYLSLRRMKNALGRAAGLFSEEEEYEQLRQIEAWSRDTTRRLARRPALQAVARGVGRSGQRHDQLHGPQVPHLRRVLLLPGPAADEPRPDPRRQPRPVLHRPGPPHGRRRACCPGTTS